MLKDSVLAANDLRQACRHGVNTNTAINHNNHSNTTNSPTTTTSNNNINTNDGSNGIRNSIVNNNNGGCNNVLVSSIQSPLVLLDDSPLIQHLRWVIDPLRLTIAFQGESAVDIDERMCEG